MSDIHALPLRGRDMPEIDYASDLRKSPYLVQPPAKARRKARVWWGPDGWRWEHACHPMKWTDSGCPFASPGDASDAALRHLKGCCR